MKYILVAAFGTLPFVSALPTTGYDVSATASPDSLDTNASPLSDDGSANWAAGFLHRGDVGSPIAHPTLSKRADSPRKTSQKGALSYAVGKVGRPEMREAMRQVQEAASKEAAAKGETAALVRAHNFLPNQLGWDTIIQDSWIKSISYKHHQNDISYIRVEDWDGKKGQLLAWAVKKPEVVSQQQTRR
ncbi:uncharacterized protein PgNI_00153 [Pyricularia grisea]|uniref:SCP domain-containing protein n=1 Tax=Pyricularia grisea TaxID=148305 RepID=A0A6P8BFL7_PYRGI|nr:uncharacterized protein PgNI_00153 [Pyricularia grisea]TLD15442.1 hypothetical protein PgNI_00153 [Pyricularia grisea]